jgi:hypothetical protein
MKRVNDFVIMDKVCELDIPLSTKQTFNNWRLYFQVNSIADITNLQGDKIDPIYLNKKRVMCYVSKSRIRWPKQKVPNVKYFSIWINILKKVCEFKSDGTLTKKLGEWLVNQFYTITTKF